MTTIGYATLQIIPSLDGVSASIDKQLGGKLQVAGKQGGKALAKGVGEGMKDLERDVESATRAYGKLKDKAADALGKVRSDEAALQRLRNTGASDDRIIKAEERLATSRRNSTRASRDAEDSHRSLKVAQDALGGSSDDLGRRFGGLANFAGIAGSALGAAGAVAGGAALVGIGALATGVAAAGRELYDLGAQFDDVFDNLRLKTGATGPALQELENATNRIASTVPATIADIGDVVAETSRAFKGLSGADFDNLTSHIANLNRLTGENVNVRNLGKAYRIMGVDLKDQVPTLDAFWRASENSGIGVNELIGVVNRGGAQLKQFGLDMGSSAALVSSFEEAGVDASKVIPALTKALGTFAKAGTDPRKGLEDTITQVKALADAGNETGALDLANKVFGAKGGVAFAEVIKSGNLDIQDLNTTLATTGDTIDQAVSDTDDWAERWQVFKNSAQVALQPLASGTFDVINTQLTSLADVVQRNQPAIIEFFTRIGLAAVSMGEFVIKSVGLVAEGIGQLFTPLTAIVSTVLKAAAAFERLGGFNDLADQLDGAANSMTGVTDGLKEFGAQAKNVSAAGIYDDIKKYGERAAEAARFTAALGDATASLPDGHTITITDNSPETIANLKAIGVEVIQTPTGLTVTAKTDEAKRILQAFRDQQTGAPITPVVRPNLGPANQDMQNFVDKWTKEITVAPPPVTPRPTGPGSVILPPAGRATGGAIHGAGTATSDSIPAWLSNGEHVWTADEVKKAGGQGAMYRMRAMIRGFDVGGAVNGSSILDLLTGKNGTPYYGSTPERAPVQGFLDGLYRSRQIIGTTYDQRTDPSGINPKFAIDTSATTVSRGHNPNDPTSPGFDPWAWTWDDTADAAVLDKGEINTLFGRNPIYNKHNISAHPELDPWNKLLHGYAQGGAIGPDVQAAGDLVGTPYSQAKRTDCSGMVARVIDRTLGMPEAGLMSTKNAADWLAARGFKPGIGGPGTISVGWYDHGPNPNDGHMAMTLSDGSNAEAGGGVGDLFQIGGGAAGASSPQFDQHMFLPTAFGEGPAGASSASASPFAGGSAISAMIGSGGGGSTSSSSSSSTSGSSAAPTGGGGGGGGGGVGFPSSISGFGSALGEFASGQIQSALGVFGIPDSPGWLQAASKLIGGIKVGGGSGNSIFDGANPFGGAAPLSASPTGAGAPLPDAAGSVHGARAGQQPGPTYNIYARDTEDSFVRANRVERERSAAKLQRF